VQRNYVSLIERGRNAVTVKVLYKLAYVLGISASAILSRVELAQGTKPTLPSRMRGK
jgi:transcriptional regulator with XRE-family HTH domain